MQDRIPSNENDLFLLEQLQIYFSDQEEISALESIQSKARHNGASKIYLVRLASGVYSLSECISYILLQANQFERNVERAIYFFNRSNFLPLPISTWHQLVSCAKLITFCFTNQHDLALNTRDTVKLLNNTRLHLISKPGKNGPPVIETKFYFTTPSEEVLTKILFKAIDNDQMDVIRIALSQGADLTKENSNKKTPIHYASSNRKWRAVTTIAESTNAASYKADFEYALLDAMQTKEFTIVNLLLKKKRIVVNCWFGRKHDGNTLLHIAIRNDAPENIISELLRRGAEVNVKNKGETPLSIAIEKNRVDLITKLIESGADIAVKNKQGEVAILKSQYISSEHTVGSVTSRAFMFQNLTTTLLAAIEKEDCVFIKSLFNSTLNFTSINQTIKNQLPLEIAANSEKWNALKTIIECSKTHNNYRDRYTNVLIQLLNKKQFVLALLLLNKLPINNKYQSSNDNNTILHHAIINNATLEIVKALIAAGIYPNIENKSRHSDFR